MALLSPLLRLSGDTLRYLFTFFETGDPQSFYRLDVARCARVCKALSPYALQALWYRLDSLLPLLDLVGSTMEVRIDEYGIPLEEHTLQRDISDEDQKWETIDKYARLVRCLVLHTSGGPDYIAPQAFAQLAAHGSRTQHKRLFPGLVQLHWVHVDLEASSVPLIHFFGLLGGPTLDCLKWNCGCTGREALSVYQEALDAVVRKSPYLRRLHLQGLPDGLSLDFLENCKRLSVLELWPAFNIRACARLDTLEEISLYDVKALEVWPTDLERGFSALRSAVIHSNSINFNALFSNITSPHLSRASIVEMSDNGWQQSRALLNTIQANFSNSLSRITFSRHRYMSDGLVPLLDIIEPLLRMPLLEDVTVIFDKYCRPPPTQFMLPSADPVDIAAAWPRLRRFSLHGACSREHAPSMDALVEFARCCPKLEYLNLQCGSMWPPRTTAVPNGANPATLPSLAGIVPAQHVHSLLLPWWNVLLETDVEESFSTLATLLVATFPHCSWLGSDVEPSSELYILLTSMQDEYGFEPLFAQSFLFEQ